MNMIREAVFMKNFNLIVVSFPIWIIMISLVSASCYQIAESNSGANTEQLTNSNYVKTEAQTEKLEVQNNDNVNNSNIADVSADDLIKQVDLKNFSYPWCSKIARLKDTITLKDGKAEIIKKDGKFVTNLPPHTQESYFRVDHTEYTINDIYYGDVNSDNITDVFVSISTQTYSGEWYRADTTCSYIYTIKENKPELIWQYNYGELKYSTKRKIEFNKAQNEIIVEMYYPYKPNDLSVGQLYKTTQSESYDRLVYKWKNNTFHLISTENVPYSKLQIEQLGVVGLDN